jgi:NHLM bacteriocin system ABC transporter ATP-binding protein
MASDWNSWTAGAGNERHLMDWDTGLVSLPGGGFGALVDTGVARQVVLGGRDTLWLVTGAPLDVFAVDTRDRSPWHFLGLLQPGAVVVGSSRTARHVLAGRPHMGCSLRRLPLTGFLAGQRGAVGQRPDDADVTPWHTLTEGLDAALSVLHQALPAAHTTPSQMTTLRPGRSRLLAGEAAGCPEGVRWVIVEQGRVLPGRGGGHRDREAGEFVVVTEGDWVRAMTDARIIVGGTEDLLGSGQLPYHLVWHQEQYLRTVDEWIDRERAEQDQRLSAGSLAMADMVARADESLRSIVVPAAAGPTPGDADVEHAALAACALVAGAIGAEIAPREKSRADDATGDPVIRIAQAARVRARAVSLPDRWWRQNLGPLVGYLGPDRRPVALLPRRGGYLLDDVVTGRRRVTRDLAPRLHSDAVMLYRPLPEEPMSARKLAWFAVRGTRADQFRLFGGGLTAFLLGLGVPVLTGKVLGVFVPQGRADLVIQTSLAVLVAAAVGAGFTVMSSLALVRMEGRLDATLQAAVWDRLLKLPVSFHARYSTGELANSAMGISTIRTLLSDIANVVFSATMMALANIGLMLWYDPLLGGLAVALVVVHSTVFLLIRLRLVAAQRQLVDLEYKLSNQVFQTLRGLPKLRVAAAEGFAYAHWGTSFARNRSLSLRVKRAQSFVAALDLAYVPFAALLLYLVLAGPADGRLSVADFLTFVGAFSVALSAVAQITAAVATSGVVAPIFDKVKPLLEEMPEVAEGSISPGRLSGDIQLTDVSFRYSENGPMVLSDLSLHIRSGEFVAVVGATGCGKSTLLRLLIGFHQPTSGSVRLDGVSLSQLDVAEVRRQCAIVLQHSAPFAGTILSNICGPGTYTVDEAWAAARSAGLDEDLGNMPMGMQTLLSDGGPELSGGQRQRLMIAQALIRRPRVLFFDEATSALDNATQAVVAESTRALSVTRVVIAHRLSTIMHADRVVVMSEGRIVEMGSPDELLGDEQGLFHQLVQRQMR